MNLINQFFPVGSRGHNDIANQVKLAFSMFEIGRSFLTRVPSILEKQRRYVWWPKRDTEFIH